MEAEWDLPPSYCSATSSFPAPRYSSQPDESESVIQLERQPSGRSTISSPHEYTHQSDSFTLKLKPTCWGSRLRAYGLQGSVEGNISFKKAVTHVLEVYIAIQCVIIVTSSQHGSAPVAIPCVFKKTLLHKKMTLFLSCRGSTVSGDMPFVVHLPDHIDNGEEPLPPSCIIFQAGVSTECHYTMFVNISRKGFRRRERLSIPIYYLPKSRPTTPPLDALPRSWDVCSIDERISIIPLTPTWPTSTRPRPTAEAPIISFAMPASACFSSGEPIPLALRIVYPHSPALAKLLVRKVHASLYKRTKTWLDQGLDISTQERAISHAELYISDEAEEGVHQVRIELQAGEAGREASWSVKGVTAVEYFIRLTIRPPDHLQGLPSFRHDEPVTLTTDQYGTLQGEMRVMNGVPVPALGLVQDAYRYLRPTVSNNV